ncbi:MAG: hypothetical protein JXK05_01240 [Campylobacterales bacterium]|nr:hypothetical protein [Campylobacterales bacterium]
MNFLKQEGLMVMAALLLLFPMLFSIGEGLYEILKTVVWLIFWVYLFRTYREERRWMALFALPVLIYNPFFVLAFSPELWALLHGFFFVLSFLWLLKKLRPILLQKES